MTPNDLQGAAVALTAPDGTVYRFRYGASIPYAGETYAVLLSEEAFRPIRFFDVGALVWFARVIPWEFPGFSVEACFGCLLEAQRILEEKGEIRGMTHRFLIVARK